MIMFEKNSRIETMQEIFSDGAYILRGADCQKEREACATDGGGRRY